MNRTNGLDRVYQVIALGLIFSLVGLSEVRSQPVGELPTARYYAARELMRIGNVIDASQGFQDVLSLAQRSANDGWIDSVATRVMLAESYYHQGELAKAMSLYDAALEIVLKYPDWIDKFNLGDNVLAVSDASIKGVNWFKPTHQSVSLSMPNSVQMAIDLTQARTDPQGNIIAPLNVSARLDSTEILRTTAIALMRRWQILGPLAKYSPLTGPLTQCFSNPVKQPQAWAQSSWLLLHALATLPQDEDVAAQQLLAAAYLNNRQFDYFLTPIALQVLGEVAANKGQYQAAILNFQDASLLAAQYLQFDQLSETLLWIGDCACANRRVDLAEPLQVAANWCSKKSPFAQVAALSGVAELNVIQGRLAPARKAITQEASLLKPGKGALPRYQARMAYNEACLAFLENQPQAGWARILDAVALMRGSSTTGPIPAIVFQQQQTLDLLFRGNLIQNDGEKVLSQLAAEPGRASWELRPLETLAALTTAAVPAYQRLLGLADPADRDTVLARFDRVQQRQIFEAMPLGGRPYSWMKALTTPLGSLPPDTLPTVQATLQAFPQLEQLPIQLADAISKVRQLPMQLDERQIKGDQKQLYNQMEELADRLETQLMIQALSRVPMRRFAPDAFNLSVAQQRLAEGDLILGFVQMGDSILAVAVGKDRTEMWLVQDAASVGAKMSTLYRQIGLVKGQPSKNPIRATDPNAEWRATASELFTRLLAPNQDVAALVQSSRRIIVAPHGPLWYMPFELLIGGNKNCLVSTTAITYVPSLGCWEMAYATKAPLEQSLVVMGSFFAADKSTNSKEASRVNDIVDNSTLISLDQKQNLPSSQWLRSRTDELVLLSELQSRADNVNLKVLPIDNHPKARLGDWIGSALPAPKILLLPGLDTSIRTGDMGTGSDVFLPVSAMLFSGSRGVISRWSVGGESSSRYLQRLRREIADSRDVSTATRRASLAIWAEQFATAGEPILLHSSGDNDSLTSGEHPLLWGGYMSIGGTR